jgi:hypothetical protein
MTRLTDRDRRALRLGALVLLPALLWVWGVQPYRTALGDARAQLLAQRLELARERALLDDGGRGRLLLAAVDSASRAAEPRTFAARDDMLASAELAGYLSRTARASRVWLREADTRPAAALPSGVRVLQVEIRAESDLEGILSFLQALERGERLVRVERLAVTRPDGGDEEDDGAQALRLTATVQGFTMAPDTSDAPIAAAPPSALAGAAR